jgi:hypothetical protein
MEYKKYCTNCNKKIIYNNKYNLERSVKNNSLCRSCTCSIRNSNKIFNNSKSNNSQWKGYKDIPYNWFSKYFERANKTKRTGNITIKNVYDLWIKQNKKCNLSGLNIGFYDDNKTHTCSIDRIDSSKEYEINNIQLVHKHINLMKNHYNNEYFINMCKLIAENNKSNK